MGGYQPNVPDICIQKISLVLPEVITWATTGLSQWNLTVEFGYSFTFVLLISLFIVKPFKPFKTLVVCYFYNIGKNCTIIFPHDMQNGIRHHVE